MDREKKVSFGFNKINKKPFVSQNKHAEKKDVELIECLEGQSIKIKGASEVIEEPLVIPIKDDKKGVIDIIIDAKAKQKSSANNKSKKEENRPDSDLTIEELAVKELINDAKNHLSNKESNKAHFILPLKEDRSVSEETREPTIDDYEKIPISDYGLAMLRGMGWKEGMGIGKNPSKYECAKLPELRPKGLGLGASRIVKAEISTEPICDKDGNALILKPNAYAKIIAGPHKGNYCEVQGLDEEAGRVIVRTSIKGEILTVNELFIVPVTKEEYLKRSKVTSSEISENLVNDQKKNKAEYKKDIKRESEKQEKQKHFTKVETDNNKLDSYEKDHKYNQDKYVEGKSRSSYTKDEKSSRIFDESDDEKRRRNKNKHKNNHRSHIYHEEQRERKSSNHSKLSDYKKKDMSKK